jgi:hypothetical protein
MTTRSTPLRGEFYGAYTPMYTLRERVQRLKKTHTGLRGF